MSLSVAMNDPNGRQYSRDSFDRFGDDLCELLLSYLDFEDKFRFECVSTQWRRLIFNNVIYINDRIFWPNYVSYLDDRDHNRQVKDQQMKTILKKCHNLKTIKLYVNEQTVSSLSLLSDNCHRLKSIELEVNQKVSFEAMLPFCQTLGSKVEELSISRLSYHNKTMLSWFPNLKRIYGQNEDVWLSLFDNQLVPKLNHLSRLYIGRDRISRFVQFVDKYEKTLKNIKLDFDMDIDIDFIFKQLCRLKNLESIDLFRPDYRNLDIAFNLTPRVNLTPRITELSRCCPKLSKVILHIREIELSLPSKSLKTIKSSTIYCNEMSDNFFANLSELMPNLKLLSLTSETIYTNEHLNYFSRMKDLKRLELRSYKVDNHLIEDSAVIQLLDNCKEMKELKLNFRSNLTVKTIERLIEFANSRYKQRINFSTKDCVKDFTIFGIEIPDNLLLFLSP